MLYMKVAKRVNLKEKKKEWILRVLINYFGFVAGWDDGCWLNLIGYHFIMYGNQIIMLYTLNIYSVICQLHLNKTEREKTL